MPEYLLRESIDPRLLEALFSYFPNSETALLELVDNAIADRIDAVPMEIRIKLGKDTLEITNKGGSGMNLDRIQDFLTWGKPSEEASIFRFYGQGGKAALGYLGKDWKLWSIPKDQGVIYEAEVKDWRSHDDGLLKTVPIRERKTTMRGGAVQFQVSRLTVKLYRPRIASVLSAVYCPLLQRREVLIWLNGKPIGPAVLPCDDKREFEDETPLGKVRGWVGHKAEGSSVRGGIRCYAAQGRLIREREFFGLDEPSVNTDAVIGEVEADFVPVLPNKTDYDRGGPEWEVLRACVEPKLMPVLRMATQDREVPLPLKKLEPEVETAVNQVLRDVDPAFALEGRKPREREFPWRVVSLKREKQVEEQDKEQAERERHAASPPPADAVGSLTRLGHVGLQFRFYADDTIRCRIDRVGEKQVAFVNTTFPAFKLHLDKRGVLKPGFMRMLKAYCCESVALELYQDMASSIADYTTKVTNALWRAGLL